MEPNYAVAPGEYLKEWIDDEELTQGDVASLLGTSRKTVNALIHGRIALSEDMALRLERVTHIPAKSWLTFEAGYREDLARLHSEEALAAHVDNIDATVAAYLRKCGYIKSDKRTPGRLVAEFLTFHQVGTFEAYEATQEAYHQGEYALATLKEPRTRRSGLRRYPHGFVPETSPKSTNAAVRSSSPRKPSGRRFPRSRLAPHGPTMPSCPIWPQCWRMSVWS